MKKGIHYWALPHTLNLREKMEFAKRLGFEGIELVIVEKGELQLDCRKEELMTIRQAAKETGIEIISVSSSLNWKCSFTSDDAQMRKKAGEMLRKQLYIAAELNSEVALALPGFVTADFISDEIHPSFRTHKEEDYHPGLEIIDYNTAYERSLRAFEEIAPIAERVGVTVGIENVWNHFLMSPLEMRQFIDEIGSNYVQVYFDVGNVQPSGYPEQWIRILGARIKRVHVKDFRKGCSSVQGFVNLLSGDIDFVKVMQALHEIGYNGWITAEVNEKWDYPEFAAKASELALEQLLEERSNSNV